MNRIDQILNSLSSIESKLMQRTSRWMTINEAASYLKLSTRSIRRYLNRGLIPQHRLTTGTIRIERKDLDSMVIYGCPYRRLTRHQRKTIIDTQEY